jgi:maltose alpha-D-glucosyltransferase/alpha-amylase
MAVRREQSLPITEILAQTPTAPERAQWAIFLRNHDELTLEMVTDEERDYLFAEYAKDPRMKRHMGIGRRLAPLLERDRRLSELLYYLLFTLPGSPVLYYGDEIQMGDNLYLGDRDSVRTPMQWTPDRNGGFSRADFAQLYLPPLMDPVYGFAAVNVEAQQRNTSSFLHWMRRILAVRRQFPILGTGRIEVVSSASPSVLAFVRSAQTHEGTEPVDPVDPVNPVLCVHNLSRLAQPAEIHVGQWTGAQPIELLGRVAFPLVGADPYSVTLGPYGSLCFELA